MTEPTHIRQIAENLINRILTDSGRAARPLQDGDSLMGSIGLDSLDVAVMVVGLEQELDVDPFRDSAATVQTFGELVTLYKNTIEGHA